MWREIHTFTSGEWTQLGNPDSQLWIERNLVVARLPENRSPAKGTILR